MITSSEILKGSEYSLTQFSKEKILQLEERIEEKEVKGKPSSSPYILSLQIVFQFVRQLLHLVRNRACIMQILQLQVGQRQLKSHHSQQIVRI